MKLISKFKTLLESCEKSPLKSKTLWVNGLTMVAGVLALLYDVASPEWAISAIAGVNILLRFVTSGSITPTGENGESVSLLDNISDIIETVTNVAKAEVEKVKGDLVEETKAAVKDEVTAAVIEEVKKSE